MILIYVCPTVILNLRCSGYEEKNECPCLLFCSRRRTKQCVWWRCTCPAICRRRLSPMKTILCHSSESHKHEKLIATSSLHMSLFFAHCLAPSGHSSINQGHYISSIHSNFVLSHSLSIFDLITIFCPTSLIHVFYVMNPRQQSPFHYLPPLIIFQPVYTHSLALSFIRHVSAPNITSFSYFLFLYTSVCPSLILYSLAHSLLLPAPYVLILIFISRSSRFL